MRRREFITLIGGAAAAWPLTARAQQPVIPVIGVLDPRAPDAVIDRLRALRQGLKGTGYVEGENVAIVYRWADGQNDRLPELAAELVRRKVSVIASFTTAATFAAKAATTTIPIVFAHGGDPVRDGLVASLNRPGANVTGVSFLASNLGTKKLELIRSMLPRAKTIAVLESADSVASQAERVDVLTAARAVGQRVVVLTARTERDFDPAFATLARERAAGLVVTGDALFASHRDRLIALAARYAVPTIHTDRSVVEAGGLMSYAASVVDAYRQVGVYTGRILKGERPADLPVVQPTKFELAVNLKTAKALRLTISPSVLARADGIIE
jgi:putative ABC transport system substrate-binding protein